MIHHEVTKYIRESCNSPGGQKINDATLCLDTIFPDAMVWKFQYTKPNLQYMSKKKHLHASDKVFKGNNLIILNQKTRYVSNADSKYGIANSIMLILMLHVFNLAGCNGDSGAPVLFQGPTASTIVGVYTGKFRAKFDPPSTNACGNGKNRREKIVKLTHGGVMEWIKNNANL